MKKTLTFETAHKLAELYANRYENLELAAEKFGVEYSRISVRNQSGRWASRSSSGALSFNERMLLLPCELQNYIICHELAHARFMDHSVSFWIWLGRLCPHAKRLDRELSKLSGKLFSDCTGDAYLAAMAGAECRMGREARAEFGESLAPVEADGFTMGVSIEWYCEDWNTPCTFPDSLDWWLRLDDYTVEPVHRANWYWEVGMRDDQVADAEKIRDYGMYVAYSTFSYCKNRYSKKEDWTCTHLVWVSHVSGKRESRRVVGDYILREQDLTRPIRHEDETCTTTWRIDQHYPIEKNSQQYPGAEWLSEGVLTPIDFYALPYRCFYSKDVRNMFMAGRNISVTHIALGSTRVMRTCGMIGEVVGMAASVCMKRNALPRDIYTTYFADLQELMRKGTGRTDVPYTQFYHQVDRTGHQAEDR